MKRLLYLDKDSNEIDDLLAGRKSVVVRAANIKKYPYKMIDKGYRVYLLNNNSEGIILASANVKDAIFEEKPVKEERLHFLSQFDFRLSSKKMKYVEQRKYISIFILDDIKEEYATFDSSKYGQQDDFLIINNIQKGEII